MITQGIIMSHDVVRYLRCRSRRFYCLLLVFIMRWGRLITLHHLYHDGQEWCISILIVPGRYSQCGPLYCSPDPKSCSLRQSAAVKWSPVMLLYREYPRFRNVYSIIPVDQVIRVVWCEWLLWPYGYTGEGLDHETLPRSKARSLRNWAAPKKANRPCL